MIGRFMPEVTSVDPLTDIPPNKPFQHIRSQKARKDYVCDWCGKPIKKGDNYFRNIIPPWSESLDDGPIGHWEITLGHSPYGECEEGPEDTRTDIEDWKNPLERFFPKPPLQRGNENDDVDVSDD